MNRNRKLARFNWYVLLACALMFAIGGTVVGIAAIILSGHIIGFTVSITLSIGLYLAAGAALHQMERC